MKASMQNASINYCTDLLYRSQSEIRKFILLHTTSPGNTRHVTNRNQHVILYFTVYQKKFQEKSIRKDKFSIKKVEKE